MFFLKLFFFKVVAWITQSSFFQELQGLNWPIMEVRVHCFKIFIVKKASSGADIEKKKGKRSVRSAVISEGMTTFLSEIDLNSA